MSDVSGTKAEALVLIPARDEAAAIGRIVASCGQAGFTVWVIDDASSDETARVAAQAGAEILTPAGRAQGKTAALRHAMTQVPDRITWLFFLDGDGQHDPADLDRFWQAREPFDLIVGNRLPDAAHMPTLRRWTNQAMSRLLRRSGIADSQCGFRLVRRSWLKAWLPLGHQFQFESEMALLAAAQPSRVLNLPIAATYAQEASRIAPWRDGINFLRCLMRARMH